VTRRFIQPMLEGRRGSIINVCSSSILAHAHGGGYTALRPHSHEMPYMASKAALATMCFYLADEVKAQNVAVNLILPGHTRTTGSNEQTRLRAAMGATNAPKILVPEHVVPLVLYLASQDASQITGKLFDVVQWNLEHGLGGRERWGVPE
jgi:NAD(P)-dependent dehydrogenase (short-subunit alcohol dehydrogenase family)